MNTHVEQDRCWESDDKGRQFAIALPTWTVYVFVQGHGNPDAPFISEYQTPVFTGTEKQCRKIAKELADAPRVTDTTDLINRFRKEYAGAQPNKK